MNRLEADEQTQATELFVAASLAMLVFIMVFLRLSVTALAVVLGQPLPASILAAGAFLTLGSIVVSAAIRSRREAGDEDRSE